MAVERIVAECSSLFGYSYSRWSTVTLELHYFDVFWTCVQVVPTLLYSSRQEFD